MLKDLMIQHSCEAHIFILGTGQTVCMSVMKMRSQKVKKVVIARIPSHEERLVEALKSCSGLSDFTVLLLESLITV